MGDMKQQVGKVPTWKAPGPDGIYDFWLKRYHTMYEILIAQLNECVQKGSLRLDGDREDNTYNDRYKKRGI